MFMTIRSKSYELYKLYWCMKTGYDLSDILDAIENACSHEQYKRMYLESEEKLEVLEREGFFDNHEDIWKSYPAFISCEYLDEDFMKTILPLALFDEYDLDMKIIGKESESDIPPKEYWLDPEELI